MDRFVTYARPGEGIVVANPALYSQIARLPEVAGSARVARLGLVTIDANGRPFGVGALGDLASDNLGAVRPIVVSGRMPIADRIGEVAVNVSAARNEHLAVGGVIRFRAFSPAQADAMLNQRER